ncbi:MAG: sugar-binding protein [Planctomycetota bacterium]|nr:sugar-binding protein [Planctomycetota bacterium]
MSNSKSLVLGNSFLSYMMLAVLASGCGGSPAPSNKEGAKPDTGKKEAAKQDGKVKNAKDVKVAFVSNNPAEFWTIAEAGARKAELETGSIVIFKRPQDASASTQKQIIEDLMTQGVNAISVSVISPENQTSFIDEIAARIPVLCVDNDAVKSKRKCYLGTANLQAGRSVGELVKEVMPQGGKIAIFVGQLDPINAQERRQGVLDVLEGLSESKALRDSPNGKKYGNYELIGTYTDNTDKNKAKDNAADVLAKNQNEENLCMIGLWAYNPPAILAAVKDSKRIGKVKIVGFDEDDNTLEAIKVGEIHGTVVQQPFEFGYQSVKLMVELVTKPESVKIPANGIIDVPHKVIKKDNVDAFHTNLKKLMNK